MTNGSEPIFENDSSTPQKPSEKRTGNTRVNLPISAYIMALISAVFVTFGIMLVVGFSHLFLGDWVEKAPRWIIIFIPIGAIALGLLSGFSTLRRAIRKAQK